MKPFQKGKIPQETFDETLEDSVRAWREGKADARALIPALDEESARAFMKQLLNRIRDEETIYVNDRYQVNVRECQPPDNAGEWPPMLHLSIKRLDKAPIRDWRVMQQIKNMIVGPECEAVELYPAESRLVDTANQYHLWALKDPKVRFPFGFEDGRLVVNSLFGKGKQRPV